MWAVWFISMDRRLYIALLELRFDYRVSASLFVRLLLTLLTEAQQTEKLFDHVS